MSTGSTTDPKADPKAATPESETKSPAELLDANLETFLGKFKSITPDQQIALNNLRDSIDAVKSGDKDKGADKGKAESSHSSHASKPSSSY